MCQVFRSGYRRLGMVDSIVYGEKYNGSRKTLRDVCLLTALTHWSRLRVVSRRLRILGLLRQIFRRTGNGYQQTRFGPNGISKLILSLKAVTHASICGTFIRVKEAAGATCSSCELVKKR